MHRPPLTKIQDILAPHRSALVVIDLQNDFIHPEGWSAKQSPEAPSLRHVIPVVNELVAAARRSGVAVVYVTIEHGPDIDAPNYQARYATRGMERYILCARGTWGAALDSALAPPEPADIVVARHSYDGFSRTELESLLRDRGIETCVFTGVVTNLCVQDTAHHAFSLGFYVVLASDGTAAATALEHDVAVDAFQRFFGPVLTGRTIAEFWSEGTAVPRSQASRKDDHASHA